MRMFNTGTKMILAVCALAALIAYSTWMRRVQLACGYELRDLQHITNALVSYASAHQGRLPNDWNDLVAEGYTSPLPGNPIGLHIKTPMSSEQWDVKDITRYRIAWGMGPGDVYLGEGGLLYRSDKSTRLLIVQPSSSSFVQLESYAGCSSYIAERMLSAASGDADGSATSRPGQDGKG